MARTARTGYLPAAVSAESITASVPSMTALATSLTSARVGRGVLDHRFHHLRRGDDDAIAGAGLMDDRLLQAGELGVSHLDAEIAARDHHHIRRLDDADDVGDGFLPLDLRDDAGMPARIAHQGARLLDIRRIAREGDGDVIDAYFGGKADVLAILVGQRRRGDAPALAVEALAVGELTAHAHHGLDARARRRSARPARSARR